MGGGPDSHRGGRHAGLKILWLVITVRACLPQAGSSPVLGTLKAALARLFLFTLSYDGWWPR